MAYHCYKFSNISRTCDPIAVINSLQDKQSTIHCHDYLEIAIVHRGYGTHVIYDQEGNLLENSIVKGDVFTILDKEVHSYKECVNFRLYNFCLSWEFFEKYKHVLETLKYYDGFLEKSRKFGINQLHLQPVDFVAVEELVKKLNLALHSKKSSHDLLVSLITLELLYVLFDGNVKGWKRQSQQIDERLFKVIAEMEKHPEKHQTIVSAALKCNMSASNFAHKFKDAVGVSPTEYNILLRLENVRSQLKNGNTTIMEIALQNGFCDGNYLTRLFKKRYGMTPREYRKFLRGPDMF